MRILVREHVERLTQSRRGRVGAAVASMAFVAVVAAWGVFFSGARRPPSIFDAPADNLAGYLATADFNRLPMQERLDFVAGLMTRFGRMSPSDSAGVAAFFAGLGAPARQQLRSNVRILAKDILIDGAQEYLAIPTEQERARFLDRWIVKWARFAEQLGGDRPPRSDEELLARMHRQAERDARHAVEFNAGSAQEIIDFWQTDIAPVTTPREQGQLVRFLPDLQKHLLKASP